MRKILIVDQDADMCRLITRFLSKNNYLVCSANSGKETIEWMKKNQPDVVLCESILGDMSGIQLMKMIKEKYPLAIVVVTGTDNAKDAIEIVRAGGYDYVTKPIFPDGILAVITRALGAEPKEVAAEAKAPGNAPKTSLKSAVNSEYFTGNSPEIVEINRQIDLVAPTNFSVIIYGESGSGKEAIARQIHAGSKRSGKPFVAIDCGALSKELSGSELFGHEKGAFTGALNQKLGCLEIADGGTIFLDEIGNLSYDIQISLLRVVQERQIRRVGGNKDIPIDVRIIIASNVNLWDAAKAGKFREDLYHRFNEFSIALPSLHDRKQDIMLLANHFLKLTNAELGKDVKGFTKEVEKTFTNYIWSGNIRELKNVIRRATLLTDGSLVEMKSLPAEIGNYFNQLLEDSLLARPQISYDLMPKNASKHKTVRTKDVTNFPSLVA